MPMSFGSPLKYEISRAARELEVTRLLRAPHMFTTTSLDGVFWWPSPGSFDTKTFTTMLAAKTENMCLWNTHFCSNLNVRGRYFTTYPCGLCWSSALLGFSAGQWAALAPRRCWCLKDPVGWAASSPAPAPHHSEPMPTWTQDKRPHKLYYYCSLENEFKNVNFACLRTYPGLSCGDILHGPYSGLTTSRVAVTALENKLIESHHLRVPKPLSPFGLARHFR